MKSKTTIGKQIGNKTNDELVSTIVAAKKSGAWLSVASLLSSSRRNAIDVNLSDIDKIASEGDIIVVPGKVLSQGEVKKKIRIAAYKFSEKAKEKLLKEKAQLVTILEEIKQNPDAKGVKIVTGKTR